MSYKPYQKGLDYGLVTGVGVEDPVVLGNIIKDPKNKRFLLIIGAKSVDYKVGDKRQLDILLEMAKVLKAPIVATGHVYKAIKASGYPVDDVHILNVMNITERLVDPEWEGLDGEGPYDVVIFGGHLIFHLSQMLSTVINFAYDRPMISVAVDGYYHPNARFSIPSIADDAEAYEKYMTTLLEILSAEPKC